MEADGKMVSYFRGRKLLGRIVKVPKGCKGVILSSSDRKLPKEVQTSDDHNPDEDERVDDVGILEEQANFDEVIIWGHEALPDKLTDPYVRGMEEWIALAEQVGSLKLPRPFTDNFRSIHIIHEKARIKRNISYLDFIP